MLLCNFMPLVKPIKNTTFRQKKRKKYETCTNKFVIQIYVSFRFYVTIPKNTEYGFEQRKFMSSFALKVYDYKWKSRRVEETDSNVVRIKKEIHENWDFTCNKQNRKVYCSFYTFFLNFFLFAVSCTTL